MTSFTRLLSTIMLVFVSTLELACDDGGEFDGDAGTGSGCCYWADGASHMAAVDSAKECDDLSASADDVDYAPDNKDCADETRIPGWF